METVKSHGIMGQLIFLVGDWNLQREINRDRHLLIAARASSFDQAQACSCTFKHTALPLTRCHLERDTQSAYRGRTSRIPIERHSWALCARKANPSNPRE